MFPAVTSPTSVGQVSVELVADARNLAKSLRAEVEKAFKGLDLDKAIQESIGGKTLKVKVEADLDTTGLQEKLGKTRAPKVKVPFDPDTDSIGDKVKKTRVPKVPVPLDPVLTAFQQEVRRQTASLARQTIKIPVDGDAGGLRAHLATELAAIQAQSRIQVPTEPGSRAAYEARLRAQLAEVAARVKQTVQVDVDVDKQGGAARLSRSLGDLPVNPLRLLQSAFGALSDAMQESGNAAIRAGGSIAGALSTAAGPIGAVAAGFGILVGGIGAVAAAASVAIPAITALAGAVASLPGLLAGAGAGIGTLALGFKGIADAFKPKTGGGGGGGAGQDPESRARRIAAAERGVESARRGIAAATRGLEAAERGYDDAVRRVDEAQRRAAQAQQAVNRARREAKEDLEDLNRALRGAKLDEEDATLRVTEALRALNQAKEEGNLPDIQRADLEYRQAQQALEDAKDATDDLSQASDEANKKGVDGSDKVQDALQDQKDAIQAVKDAQNGVVDAQNAIASANDSLAASYDGLKSAQDSLVEAQKKAASAGGGGGGALSKLVRLAPEARKFVNAVKALKPAFENLRLDVQNRLFKDLDGTVRNLARSYEKPLRETLGSYADTFNRFFRDLGTAVTTPKFITDIQAGAEAGRKALAAIGTSVTNDLVPAFGALSSAAGPFIESLGDELAAVVRDFGRWIQQAEKSGALDTFFTTAKEALHDMFTTGRQVTRLVGNLFRILVNGNGKNDKSAIDSFNDGLEAVNRWLEDPKNQQAIADFVDQVKQGLKDLKDAAQGIKGVLDRLFPDKDKTKNDSSDLGEEIGKAVVSGVISGMAAAVKQNFKSTGILSDFFLKGPFSLVDEIKALLGIHSPSTVMAEIGGFLIDGLIKGIGGKLGSLKKAAGRIVQTVKDGIGTVTGTLTQKGRELAGGLLNGLGNRFPQARNTAVGLKNTITGVFSNSGTTLTGAGKNVGASLANGILARYGSVREKSAGLKAQITSPWARAGQILYNVGKVVAKGLQNGIEAERPNLGKYLNALGTYIKNNKGPIAKDRVLLRPEGAAIMSGLISGIDSQKRALGDKLADVTSLVAGAQFPGLGADLDAAVASNLAIAGSHTFVLDFAPGFTGDFLVDGLRKNIKARNNGNVQAALGS